MEFYETELTNDVERSERGQLNDETTHEAERSENGQFGERLRYDPAGPYQKTRVRTDLCWLIGYILFIVVWLIIIIYGFSKGDADKWFEPRDSAGRVCGKDPGVEKRPYLVRYNNDTCDDCLICWTSCPVIDFSYSFANPQMPKLEKKIEDAVAAVEKNLEAAIAGGSTNFANKKPDETDEKKDNIFEDKDNIFEKKDDIFENKDNILEKKDTDEEKSSPPEETASANKEKRSTDDKKSGDDEKKTDEVQEETQKSEDNDANAKKNEDENNHSSDTKKESQIFGSDVGDNAETRKKYMICKPEVQLELVGNLEELDLLVGSKKCAAKYFKTLEPDPSDRRCNNAHAKIESWRYEISRMSRDLSNTKFSITGFVFISAVIALISILAMRWFALFFISGSIFVTCVVLFYLIYDSIVDDIEDKTTGVLVALFVCTVLIVSLVLLVLYLRKQIFKTCKMIKESSKAITDLMWTLLFSLLIAFIYGLILSMGTNLYFALSTIETPIYRAEIEMLERCYCPSELEYGQNATCDPATFDTSCYIEGTKNKCVTSGCYLVGHKPRSVGFLHFINYLGLYWSFWFCLGFVDTVLASVFANWYWTYNKKIHNYMTVIESFWTIGLYHLGTIALGSIIILIGEITKCLLSTFCKILEKINRPFTAAILVHMRVVYDILETFLNFINSRAYVACAMHGTDFLHSARSAYYLMMRNLNKVHKVAEISSWLTFALAVVISLVMSKISVSYYKSREDEVTFANVPSFFVFAGSLLVTWLMLRVVQAAVETIYQCFLEDSERNDGTRDKPFFATDQLSKILYCKSQI